MDVRFACWCAVFTVTLGLPAVGAAEETAAPAWARQIYRNQLPLDLSGLRNNMRWTVHYQVSPPLPKSDSREFHVSSRDWLVGERQAAYAFSFHLLSGRQQPAELLTVQVDLYWMPRAFLLQRENLQRFLGEEAPTVSRRVEVGGRDTIYLADVAPDLNWEPYLVLRPFGGQGKEPAAIVATDGAASTRRNPFVQHQQATKEELAKQEKKELAAAEERRKQRKKEERLAAEENKDEWDRQLANERYDEQQRWEEERRREDAARAYRQQANFAQTQAQLNWMRQQSQQQYNAGMIQLNNLRYGSSYGGMTGAGNGSTVPSTPSVSSSVASGTTANSTTGGSNSRFDSEGVHIYLTEVNDGQEPELAPYVPPPKPKPPVVRSRRVLGNEPSGRWDDRTGKWISYGVQR